MLYCIKINPTLRSGFFELFDVSLALLADIKPIIEKLSSRFSINFLSSCFW